MIKTLHRCFARSSARPSISISQKLKDKKEKVEFEAQISSADVAD